MQMFGVGLLELIVILVLASIIIGPERLPGFASDLAKWIRQTRAYAKHLMTDFNEVVGELEKEAGASREDWKEIASVITRHTGDLGKEFGRASDQLEKSIESSGDLAAAKDRDLGNGSTNGSGWAAAASTSQEPASEPMPVSTTASVPVRTEDKPWYVPDRVPRRRPETSVASASDDRWYVPERTPRRR
jgi:sec-independent protein translocase protein TatB